MKKWLKSCNRCTSRADSICSADIKDRLSELNALYVMINCEVCNSLMDTWWLVSSENLYVQKHLTIDEGLAGAVTL